jgi:hypothetical protein
MIAAEFTPTQQAAVDRHRAFRQSIARKAAELAAAKTEANSIEPPVKALKPAAFPAEPDPPPIARKAAELTEPAAVLAESDPPGLPMIWPVIPPEDQPVRAEVYRVADIQDHVCRYYSVSKLDLLSPRRIHRIVLPRQVAIYLAKELTGRSLPDLGRRFGGRDHTTVLHSVKKIAALVLTDENLAFEVAQLLELITGEQNPGSLTTEKKQGSSKEPKAKKTYFANLYRPLIGSCGHVYDSRELADQMASRTRLVCVEFTADVPMPGEQHASDKSEQDRSSEG